MGVMFRGHFFWKIVALGSLLFKVREVVLPGHRSFAGSQDDKVGDGSDVMKYSDHVCARDLDFFYLIQCQGQAFGGASRFEKFVQVNRMGNIAVLV